MWTQFLLLILVAMLCSAIGFHKFVWFISIGYGLAVAVLGAVMFAMYGTGTGAVPALLCVLLIIYGCRLGGYLLLREKRSRSYQAHMKNEIKDGSSMGLGVKIAIWITVGLLYACEVSPVLFRLYNHAADDLCGVAGMLLMALGIVMESAADLTKNAYKKKNPKRFCDVGLFRLVRCPNYLGEVLTWTGVFLSGCSVYAGLQWVVALAGWISIVYIMFGGARRLELRQNRNYGDDPEYRSYVQTVPILLPFVPLYSVAKYEWLKG